MAFAEQEAAHRRITRMTLCTHKIMAENQAIYAWPGYTVVERRAEDGYRYIFTEKRLTN